MPPPARPRDLDGLAPRAQSEIRRVFATTLPPSLGDGPPPKNRRAPEVYRAAYVDATLRRRPRAGGRPRIRRSCGELATWPYLRDLAAAGVERDQRPEHGLAHGPAEDLDVASPPSAARERVSSSRPAARCFCTRARKSARAAVRRGLDVLGRGCAQLPSARPAEADLDGGVQVSRIRVPRPGRGPLARGRTAVGGGLLLGTLSP